MSEIRKSSHWEIYLFFFALSTLVAAITLFTGDTPWPLVWDGVKQRLAGGSWEWNPLLDERLPRLIVMLCTGASLAASGAVMQALFHNPLASPSVLGITAGGSLLVVISFVFGLHIEYPFLLPVAAFVGCILTLFIVYSFSRSQSGVFLTTLILTGIAISAVLMALQSALLYAYRDNWQLIQTLTEWEAGSTLDRSWQHVNMQLPLTLIGLAGCFLYRTEINILSLGEEEAKN
jgi:iron complex transport system permease protein